MTQRTTKIPAEDVIEAVRRGRQESGGSWKIHAIRHLRLATGAGIKEAKELIERYVVTGDCRTGDEITRDRLAEAEADRDRYRQEAREASADAGRRLRLLAEIHELLRAGRADEAIGVIVGEAEKSPALAERIGIRRLR
jgi:hypothetical protein